jgi:NAD(P)-dependent dehydrogenase (short-subunit alcohol dehydrogenase family)
MDIRTLEGRWALVTGAGSGIGRATALAFAQRGANLALCDLDPEGLDATETQLRAMGREVLSEVVDVASPDAMHAFAKIVHDRIPAVDLLMNNAGIGIGAQFLDTPLPEWERILSINLMGVVHGCQAFVPKMVERGTSGHVINVASAAGYTATRFLAAYSTTKFAVVGLSEALRDELAPEGIGVTAVCPGFTNTPIAQNSRMYGVAKSAASRAEMVEGFRRRGYSPERVAEGVLRAVQQDRAVAPISPEAWVLYRLKRWAPRLLGWLTAQASNRQLSMMRRNRSNDPD